MSQKKILGKKFARKLRDRTLSSVRKEEEIASLSEERNVETELTLNSTAPAIEMLAACGPSDKQAQQILLPLVESTIKNLSSQSPAAALTGPFARADIETIKLHLQTLHQNASSQALEIYRQLGLRSLHLAEIQRAKMEKLAEIRAFLVATRTDNNNA